MSMSSAAPNRLEGTGDDQVGGLVTKKKRDDHVFAKPKPIGSVLGLQLLARKRKQEREQTEAEEKRKQKQSRNRHDSSSDSASDDDDSSRQNNSKQYRKYRPETPSNPGGVSESAREKIKQRRERDRDKGIYAESGSKKKSDSRYDRDERSKHSDKYGDKRDRKSERRSDSRKNGNESSRRFEEWEDTPSSRHSSDGRKTTPRPRFGELLYVFPIRFVPSSIYLNFKLLTNSLKIKN